MAHGQFQFCKHHRRIILFFIITAFVLVGSILFLTRCNSFQNVSSDNQPSSSGTVPHDTEATTVPPVSIPTVPPITAVPTDPPNTTDPYVVSSASIGVTGDVLIHSPVFNAMYNGNGIYDFSGIFTYVSDYFQSYDFMVANLEVPLAGAEAGYSGYPRFNCPDAIIDALADAGVDMLLSANNHTYDRDHNGLIRTQEVIDDAGLLYLGTRMNTETPLHKVIDINGIKVGMVCYTYETGTPEDGTKLLNGIPVAPEDTNLIGSFHPDHLDQFYEELDGVLNDMYAEGAEVTMVYIHWGTEYQRQQNTQQREIAEMLCVLGVDVIVGSHPHVVQPFEVLYSQTGHRTYCIYSVGNLISNQRRSLISQAPNGHSEDGMIFGITFKKWNDGSVVVSQITVLPLWVSRDWNNPNGSFYTIIPLDPTSENWCEVNGSYGFHEDLKASYARTIEAVGEGYRLCRKLLGMAPIPLTFS